jgi:PAS domain S-box-containing protein
MSITGLDDGRHLEVNEAAVRHSGFTREEMLGRTKAELGFWVAPEQRETMMRALREGGRVEDFEVTFRTRSGAHRRLLTNSRVMRFGGVPAVLSISLDITDRIERDRAKDEFLAMLGHELRNPLGTIRSAMGVLDASVRSEQERRVVAVVNRQTAQLARLVDDLLDMSRLTSGNIALHREPVELHALARRCVDALLHSGRASRHQVMVEGGVTWTDADPARLEQVVNNLLDNALKYTPPGGRVRVHTSVVEGEAVLRVADTGRGIAPDLLPHVFDLFVQAPQGLDRPQGGMGLGLAVVNGLVRLHGGTVSAASGGTGRGSEFTIRLKAAPSPTGPEPGATSGGAQARARRRVLVVEDNDDAREMLKVLLEASGHVVDTAVDGPSGLAALRALRPDVALIDIGLPGMDGYALAREAREDAQTCGIRLVAVTGYGQAEDRARALSAGFDQHVTKPVDPLSIDELVTGS